MKSFRSLTRQPVCCLHCSGEVSALLASPSLESHKCRQKMLELHGPYTSLRAQLAGVFCDVLSHPGLF